MNDFEYRETRNRINNNGSYHECFQLRIRWNELSSILNCWGIGNAEWKKHYSTGYKVLYNTCSLELITAGSFQLIDTNRTYPMAPGDLYLLSPNEKLSLKANPDGEKKCIFLADSPVLRLIMQRIFISGKIIHLAQDNLQKTIELYDRIYNAAQNNTPEIETEVFNLLNFLVRSSPGNSFPPPLNHALSLMEKEEGLALTRDELAQQCGVGLSTLNRLFQKHLQCSPGTYRRKKRLDQACRLLSLPGNNIKETASLCGYTDSTSFCHDFKKFTGLTPGQFSASRKKIQNKV